jgi:hypothetical protein
MFFVLNTFENFKFKGLYFSKIMPIFFSWIQSFGKRYDYELRDIFELLPKLCLGFDAEPEIWILKVM